MKGRFELVPGLDRSSAWPRTRAARPLPIRLPRIADLRAAIPCRRRRQYHRRTHRRRGRPGGIPRYPRRRLRRAGPARLQGQRARMARPGRLVAHLGRIHGKPAATGVLYVRDKAGYCAERCHRPCPQRPRPADGPLRPASPTPRRRRRFSSAAAPSISPPAIATSSVSACASSSCAHCGRRVRPSFGGQSGGGPCWLRAGVPRITPTRIAGSRPSSSTTIHAPSASSGVPCSI